MFDIRETGIRDLKILIPRRYQDGRGFFSETYNEHSWAQAGLEGKFVQDNDTLSSSAFTIRGLHFQTPPFAQTKLIRVASGAVLDVAVDIRKGSPHFGKHIAVELSAANGMQLLVPRGFAHGFCTLTPDTYVIYKVDNHYAPDHEGGLRWDDPDLAIGWPVDMSKITLSERDRHHPSLKTLQSPFAY